MGWHLWLIGGWLLAQVVFGFTVSAESGLSGWPLGRWPCIVRRSEEPALFWVMFGCQTFLIAIILLAQYALNSGRP